MGGTIRGIHRIRSTRRTSGSILAAAMVTATPAAEPAAVPGSARSRGSTCRIVAGVAVGAGLLSLLLFFPRYWVWGLAGAPLADVVSIQPEFNRAFFALQQLHDPWQRIDNLTHRVIEWRLLFPVVAHYSGFSDTLYFALPFFGCLGALGAAAYWVWHATRDARVTAAATLLAATSSWFFVSTGWLAYFDSWTLLALITVSFARSRRILLGTALLAPWVDERFVLALPLCLAVRALSPAGGAEEPRRLWRDASWLAAGVAPYLVIRLGAEITRLRATSGSYWSEHSPLGAPVTAMALGVWHGLRLGWAAVCYLLLAAVRGRRWVPATAIVATIVVNLAVADDFSRSASVAVPALMAGIMLWSRVDKSRAARVLPLLCAGNLLLPAAHIIATPRSRTESYHRAPILYAYAQVETAKAPPDFANPAVYTRRGMEALQAGRLDDAAGQFDLALRIDPDFARARAHRGIVLFVKGQKAAGLAELDRALRRSPELFDVRLQRATFRQQNGDISGARDDVREALRVMPADWPKRAEAEQFERQLTSQLGAAR